MGSRTHVVILNWNGRRYVQDCLDSIFAQTYGDAKILVVDNGSTDGSAEFIRDEFPEAVLIALPENVHFARGTNAGVEVALQDPACEFVVTLNNDTRSDPEFLAGLVKAAAEERGGMVAAKRLFMDRPTILKTTSICPTRDRSGNLVQNYPMQYLAGGIPWNGMRVLAALRRRILPGRYPSPPTTGAGRGPSFTEFATATVRARLDAYAGLRMAFQKRRMRRAYRRVDNRTGGQWLPHSRGPNQTMPLH